MDKNSLVVLREGSLGVTLHDIDFKPHTFYRCSPEPQDNTFLVFGVWLTKEEFEHNFELTHTRILRDWREVGLIKEDGTVLSKTAFKKLADIHTYGRGKKALKIWYFRNSRNIIYGFYPMGSANTEALNECYEYYTEIINGNLESIDARDVQFGNRGIPICYGNLNAF